MTTANPISYQNNPNNQMALPRAAARIRPIKAPIRQSHWTAPTTTMAPLKGTNRTDIATMPQQTIVPNKTRQMLTEQANDYDNSKKDQYGDNIVAYHHALGDLRIRTISTQRHDEFGQKICITLPYIGFLARTL